MAVKKNFRNKAYGLSNPLQSLAPQLIISQRAPTFEDFAELGTEWVDQSTDTFYVLTSITGGSANWAAQSSTGSGTFTDVSITGTSGTVLEVASGGATNLGGALDVAGLTTLSGNLDAAGASITIGNRTTSTIALDTASGSYVDANRGYQIGGGITITSGAGTPSGTPTQGSLYIRTDGADGSELLYVYDGSSWIAFTAA